jgi:hypothetical protein
VRRLSLALFLLGCGPATIPEPVVIVDPVRLDLGRVEVGEPVGRRLTVAELNQVGLSPTLEAVVLDGPYLDAMEVQPAFPLPLELEAPLPVTVGTEGMPVDAGGRRLSWTVRAVGTGSEGPFEAVATVTLDVASCDADRDGFASLACGGGDCDDADPARFPGAVEICNEVDDDCNGQVDDARDGDGDGFGACEDCDDQDPGVFPGAREICNGIDDDCDGFLGVFEVDDDGDGVPGCADDCDDLDPDVFPGAPERCNGIDDDCNGVVDDARDRDGDGFDTCVDCDDTDPDVSPVALEVCNGVDDDCDGELGPDEGDEDGDGFLQCEDCDDLDPAVFPGAAESCNAVDDDCNDVVDDPGACPCVREERAGAVYQLCDSPFRAWTDARATCRGWGYDLLTITSAREDAFIFEAAVDVADEKWWMGLNDRRIEGRFVWEDGTPVTYTNWGPDEPNDSGGEDCGQLNRYADGGWNDEPCGTVLPFICELD